MERSFAITVPMLLLLILLAGWSSIKKSGKDPFEKERVELGDPDWLRDHEKALEHSKRSGKPLFILFTEVPGCSTVKGYGKRVLSDPLIADGIEEHFVPLAIFNNVEGKDREVLRAYDEATWNNPAVRIVDQEQEAVVPRLYGDYSKLATVAKINTALKRTGSELPPYLQLYEKELAGKARKEDAILNMHCFWTGEARIGAIEGVLNTQPGFMEGTEVVNVSYDPQRRSFKELLKEIDRKHAASGCFVRSEEQRAIAARIFGEGARMIRGSFRYAADDDDHALQGTPYENLSMSDLQRTRINSALALGNAAKKFLSPSQKEAIRETPDG